MLGALSVQKCLAKAFLYDTFRENLGADAPTQTDTDDPNFTANEVKKQIRLIIYTTYA